MKDSGANLPEVHMRLRWIQLFEEQGNAGLVCLRCGISRPTLRKWLKRYRESGVTGLLSESRRPAHSPNTKLTPELIQNIVTIRQSEGLGARRIRSELLFQHEIQVSQTAIQRALQRQNVKPLKHARAKHVHKRYSATFPGERMQMDTMKIASGKYQYTLIDDFSRFVYAEIYPSKSAHNTLEFLDFVNDSLVYPIVCLQTDNGTEFTADCVLNYLQESCIKWRPITPGKPHLNGKVERVQRTIWEELYSHLNLKTTNLSEELGDYLMRDYLMRDYLMRVSMKTLRGGATPKPSRAQR